MSDPNSYSSDIKRNLWREVSGGRLWRDRIVVIAYAAIAGLAVVGFALLSEQAFHLFEWLYHRAWWAILIWTPAVTVLVGWVTRRWFATLSGSGIPQVMVALEPELTTQQRTRFTSFRLSIAKILLATAGLLGGLSIGREGPSVQVAAGIMLHARRWLRLGSEMDVHALLVAGGAAGLAAAFNAPLAGVVFALEELGHKLPPRNSGLIIAGIVIAGLIGTSFFGSGSFLGHLYVKRLGWDMLLPALTTVVISGLLGGVFSRLMVKSITGMPSPLNKLYKRYPLWFMAAVGLLIAGIGIATKGATFGGGAESVRDMLSGELELSVWYAPLKLISTWLTSWAGIPGGIFAPSLSVGASIGQDVARLFSHPELYEPLIAIGMGAFLAAITQAPLTSFIIVMEMVDGGAMVLSLMTASMLSSLIARFTGTPLYPALAEYMLEAIKNVEQNTPTTASKTEAEAETTQATEPHTAAEPETTAADADDADMDTNANQPKT